MSARNGAFALGLKLILAAALVAVLILAAGKLSGLLVLAFGAMVVGVLLSGLAAWIGAHSPLRKGWTLAAAVLLVLAILAGGAWLFATQMGGQFGELARSLPAAWENAKSWIASLPGGQQLLAAFQQPSPGTEVLRSVADLVMALTSALTDLLLLLFGAMFIAANPGLYRRGLVLLVPSKRRDVADEALRESASALRKWMLGQLVSMSIIGLFTGVGLWLIGVPSPAALGLIAGLSEIIPWAGPIIASVPILLVALTQGLDTALMALVLIVAVQQLEGSLIMPYVQKKAVSLPPALTVFGVVAGGLLFGPVGLIFAAPLLVVAFVLVKRLYVEEGLDTQVHVPGEKAVHDRDGRGT